MTNEEKRKLITQLQSQGLKLVEHNGGASSRKGGAGPSDHKAVTIDNTTVMIPVHTSTAVKSDYSLTEFYPESVNCAIEQSLVAGKTISQKTPEQLAEVAAAAVRLDGIEQLVMTTGTPNTTDRGAAYLTKCAQAVKARVKLPIQAQCEPPDDFAWFKRMQDSGVDSLGMHLEVIEPEIRDRIMPGKAKVSLDYYFQAFTAAVKVFGWGQVNTYILAGLGDSIETIVTTCDRLIKLGVYPFVVPFVPITGTPLANHQPPDSKFMYAIYEQVGEMLQQAGMSSQDIKAGCAKCGACSALSTFEKSGTKNK